MKKKYTHISSGGRWQIYTLLKEDYSQKRIAEVLYRDSWTISREIKRNSLDGEYRPLQAQWNYEKRRSEINKWRNKLKNNPEMLEVIRKHMIEDKRAPHSIAWLKKKQWKSWEKE